MRKLTDIIDLQTLKDKYLSGMSCRDLAKELGFNTHTIWKHLKKLGVIRNQSEASFLANDSGKHKKSKLFCLIERPCSKCKLVKLREEFPERKTIRSGTVPLSICKKCTYSRTKKWATSNKKRMCELVRLWRSNNKQRHKENSARHRANYPDKYKKYSQNTIKKSRNTLSDGYVKSLLVSHTKLKRSQVPSDLIEAKRVQLQIKRYLKEQA